MALYTNIKGPINYTIVGSPTIEDGVVSGFSSSNYLNFGTNRINLTLPYTIGIKVMPSVLNTWGAFAGDNYYILFRLVNAKFQFLVRAGSTDTWNVLELDTYFAELNKYTYLRYEYDGINKYTISASDDKITWISKSATYTFTPTTSSPFSIKPGQSGSINIASVDLNETYININDNAWFGTSFSKVKVKSGLARYTVVGSPTIMDGVLSDLSYNDYIITDTSITLTSTSNIELYTRFKLDVLTGGFKTLFNIGSIWSSPILSVYNDYVTGLSGDIFQYRLSLDTWYRVKLTGNNGIWHGYVYDDNGNLLYERSKDSTFNDRTGVIIIGGPYGTSSPAVNSIDLNNTYVKLNDNYFFRGSKQDILGYKIKYDNLFSSDYIIDDGKLKWANSNIYLQDDLTNAGKSQHYFKAGFVPTNKTTFEVTYKIGNDSRTNRAPFRLNTPTIDGVAYGAFGFYCNGYPDFAYFGQYTSLGVPSTYSSRSKMTIKSSITNNYYVVKVYIDNNLIVSKNYNLVEDQQCFGELFLNCWHYGYTRTGGSDNSLPYYSLCGNLYRTKFYENGIIIRDFVPVPKDLQIGSFTVPSNGMFDIVNQQFYPNQGTGTFTYGKDS